MQKTLIWIFSPPDKRKHLSSFFKKQFRTDEENKNICDTCLKKSKQ